MKKAYTAFFVSIFTVLSVIGGNWQVTRNNGIITLGNDNGYFAGIRANSLIVASGPGVVARKKFDLSKIPADIRKKSKQVFLRLHMGIWDFSQAKKGAAVNGLDEKFVVRINGHEMIFETADDRFPACGYPADMPNDAVSIGLARHRSRRRQDWVNLSFPAEYLGNSNEAIVEIQKIKSKNNDDFVCLSVDISAPRSSSYASFDMGKNFTLMTTSQPEGMGEYLMRLVFSEDGGAGETAISLADNKISGDQRLIGYSDSEGGWCEIELNTDIVNNSADLVCRPVNAGKITFTGKDGNPVKSELKNGVYRFAAGNHPYAVKAEYSTADASLTFEFAPALELPDPMVDMAPAINAAKGKRLENRKPACRIEGNQLIMENPALRAVFSIKPFSLLSLTGAETAVETVKQAGLSKIFRIKSGKKIYDIHHAQLKKITPVANGVDVLFFIPQISMEAVLDLRIEADELRMGMTLTNRGKTDQTFAVAFPHFAGLGFSDDGKQDYFLFPWGGGAISNRDSSYRFAYGTNDALWQMIDLFSPEHGGGIYLRCDDPKAIFKTFNLRKGASFPAIYQVKSSHTGGRDPENQFTDSLEARPRIGISIDYQQLTRKTGGSYTLPEVCIGTHAGDWRYAMRRYTQWSKKTFPVRPLDKRIAENWNLHGGIGHTKHTKPGTRYSTGFLKNPREQFIELDSYWTLADKAPWGTSWEEFDKLVAAGKIRSGSSYWTDPDTGKRVFALNRGDYAGYNPQWGGLPALQKYIKKIQDAGHPVILYTDPVIACHNTINGKPMADKFGVHNMNWRNNNVWGAWPNAPKLPQVCAYLSYVMDVNIEEYARWIAENMARLCRETGADGIRLDEYGHRGYVCLNKEHKHIFGEYGQNAWLEAVRYGVKLIRKEMDKDDPSRLILTEFPGHDALAAELDAALSYDVCRRYGVNAPFPVNIYRFYFPECKLYELNVRGPANSHDIWLWEAAGAYNALYPTNYLKVLNTHCAAFNGNGEPLIPTLKKFVYANRFEAHDKSEIVYTLHNASKFTVSGDMLEVPANRKYTDAFTGREVTVKDGKLQLKISSGKTAVIVSSSR